ncbi:sulfurtransferase [Oerskovia flava]|uniref:sulfurtransferase n=1 Tax=Oerskovia flava TaxID=2986422 RepID=UPI00223EE78A|nr:sulfurtransferase [Oerskovia sp. JB1-3-2]
MSARSDVLVTVGGLAPGCVLLDVRWVLGRTDGHAQYLAGHLPGAVYVDLESELAAPASPASGRHPLPDVDALQAAARRWGVRADSDVVVYDAVGGTSAARAWWLLRWAGHGQVRILDGGLEAWLRAGRDLETGDVVPEPGDVVVRPGAMPVLGPDDAAHLASSGTGVLLDARAAERYRGEIEPVDPRAGHVPGAVSAPTADNLTTDGTFLDESALAARFRGLGAVPGARVGVYCGSGVTAAHEVAALAAVGVDAALWAGSWSQWSNDPARPVEVGPGRR